MRAARELVERTLARFIELEAFDRAMALAGQAFAALLPLLIVVAAISPTGAHDLADSMIGYFDLSGPAANIVRESVAQPPAMQDGVSLAGAFVLLLSGLSFTRALQRLYERAWRLPSRGVRGNAQGLQWLAGLSVFLSVRPVLGGLHGTAGLIFSLGAGTALWLLTPWLLLDRRLAWRVLAPQALLTAAGLGLLGVVSTVYMPRAVARSADQFGVFGVAFALLSWLFLAGLVLVATAALGAVLGESGARSPRPGDATSPVPGRAPPA